MTSGWEEATAISTIALAAVTAWLAASTRKLAREAGAETRANWQPVLTIAPVDTGVGSSPAVSFRDGTLVLGIRNVGRGPALVVRGELFRGDGIAAMWNPIGGRTANDVVAPDEWQTVSWSKYTPPREPGQMSWVDVRGRITYGDVGYAQSETVILLSFSLSGDVALADQRFRANTALVGGPIRRTSRRIRMWWYGTRMGVAWDRLARALARRWAKPHS